MFSAISSFSPKNIFKRAYSTVVAGLDLDTKLVAPKPASQAAFDKAFWAAHYNAMIEELAEDFTQKSSSEQSLEILKERLLDCQNMIGRRTLSPKVYEEGIQDLVALFEENALADESLSAMVMLDQIRSDFQEAVREQSDFIKECFMGDVDHLVGQWEAGKVPASYVRERLAYYADVMEPAHYHQGLLSLKSHLQTKMPLVTLLRSIDRLLSEVDLSEVAHSREALSKAAEAQIGTESLLSESLPETFMRSEALQAGSLANRLWEGGWGGMTYIITHPLQALTAVLAAQYVSVRALSTVSAPSAPSESLFSIAPVASVRTSTPLLEAEPFLPMSKDFSDSSRTEFLVKGETESSSQSPEPSISESLRAESPSSTLSVSFSPSPLLSPSSALGLEFQVNTYQISTQYFPAVATLADGRFVATWQSYDQDRSGYGIFAQVHNASGAKIGGEFQVNTHALNEQDSQSIAGLADGGFVVAWASLEQDRDFYEVYAQQYDANAVQVGHEFRVNSAISGNQYAPSIAALRDGGFVVAWESAYQDQGASDLGIYAQLYNAIEGPIGDEFRVNTYLPADQSKPSITGLVGGGFVVIWQSAGQDGSGSGIYGQGYDARTLAQGPEFRVNTYTNGKQSEPSVAAMAGGGFVVTWQSEGQDESSFGIYGQCYDTEGLALGTELRVNSYTQDEQSGASVAALTHGGFVVTWQSKGQDGSGFGVYGQRYNAACQPLEEAFQLNTYTDNDQAHAVVSALNENSFVVLWDSTLQDAGSWGVYGRIYAASAIAFSFSQSPSASPSVLRVGVPSGSSTRARSGTATSSFSASQTGPSTHTPSRLGALASASVALSPIALASDSMSAAASPSEHGVPSAAPETMNRTTVYAGAGGGGSTLVFFLIFGGFYYAKKRKASETMQHRETLACLSFNEHELANQAISLSSEAQSSTILKDQPIPLAQGKKKAWHFEGKPDTEVKDAYVLLSASALDIQKVLQCYAHHAIPGYDIQKVEVIYNPGMNRSFALNLGMLQARSANDSFLPTWSQESEPSWRRTIDQRWKSLSAPYQDEDYPEVKIMPAWHGTRPEVLDSIFRAGYANLASTDLGFFGKGLYFSHEARYAYQVYSQGALVLNWVSSYSAYPVIRSDMETLSAKANYRNYDAHFVPVVPQNPNNPNEKTYYPTVPGQAHQYTEMVVFQASQCLPRYLVTLQPSLAKTPSVVTNVEEPILFSAPLRKKNPPSKASFDTKQEKKKRLGQT